MKSTRHKLKPKRSWDNKGISGFWTIIILLIVIIGGWQFVGSTLNYPTPYSLLSGDGEPVYWQFNLFNKITQEKILLSDGSNVTHMKQLGETYSLKMESNVPYRLTNAFRVTIAGYYSLWVVDKWVTTGILQLDAHNIPIDAIWSNNFEWNLNFFHNTTTPEANFFIIQFFNPDGILYHRSYIYVVD